MTIIILSILGGLLALFFGGELLVRGAVGISKALGISSLVTGLVIVGAATSMPELVASVGAALKGSPGLAWGNIAGSNIANSLLILGGAALVAPLLLKGVGKRDAMAALAASLLLWAISQTQLASPLVGIALLGLLAAYIVWRLRSPPARLEEEEAEEDAPRLAVAIPLLIAGVGVLVLGGELLVSGAIDLAQLAGMSETAIGLTIVAVGTSLPELAASVAAAYRGQAGLALGNVVGSNLFNLLLIGGVTMTLAPVPIPRELLDYEWPVMVATAAGLLLIAARASRIGRAMGGLLLAAFAGNTVFLLINA